METIDPPGPGICPRCGTELPDPVAACPACAPPARGPSRAGILSIAALALLAIGGILAWQWNERQQPVRMADRFCQLVMKKDWPKVYALLQWPADATAAEEKTFVTTARMAEALFTIQDYNLGDARRDVDHWDVPVTVTAKVRTLLGEDTRTGTLTLHCARNKGTERVRPQVPEDFMGIGPIVRTLLK
jgi:hypothetical protein